MTATELGTTVTATLGGMGLLVTAVVAWRNRHIPERNLAHEEAKGIFADATKLREELRQERRELREEVERLTVQTEALHLKLNAAEVVIAELQKRLSIYEEHVCALAASCERREVLKQ